jgi:hypothetical protein
MRERPSRFARNDGRLVTVHGVGFCDTKLDQFLKQVSAVVSKCGSAAQHGRLEAPLSFFSAPSGARSRV